MANFFSAEYWRALYFKAMGGQATAVDPNALSGSFAGTSSWTGTLSTPQASIAGSWAGSSEFSGSLTNGAAAPSLGGRLIRRLHKSQRSTRRRPPPLSPEPVSAPPQNPAPLKIKRGLLTKLGKEPEYQQTRIVIEMAQRAVASGMNKKAIKELDIALAAIDGPRLKGLEKSAAAEAARIIGEEAARRRAEIEAEMDEDDEIILLLAA